jgi:G3E family GTPase
MSDDLRFKVGQAVICNVGSWTPGKIIKLKYREPSWPAEKLAPYQVELHDGRLIFAPIDDDRVIREYNGEELPESNNAEPVETKDEDKTPVTIVTGFLGSGKTTLVNYILNEPHGKKIAIIENEFGAVNIDEDLVAENLRAAEDIISMDNGCVCCTVRGDLVKALNTLAKRRKDFDCIILETTGLADPAPVCNTFSSDASIGENFRIDGIITLVDCAHVEQHLEEEKPDGAVNEAVQQVAFADKIMVNKIDLVDKEHLERVKSTIRSINGFAELIESEQSRIPLDKLLDLQSFNLDRVQEIDPDFDLTVAEEEECTDEACTLDHDHSHGHGHEHGDGCADEGCTQDHDHGHGHEHGHKEEKKEDTECHDVACKDEGHDHSHGHDHAHQKPKPKPKQKRVHDLSGVGSVGIVMKGSLNMEKFNAFMQTLLSEQAADLYRSKGVLSFKEGGEVKFVFQGVHEQIISKPASTPWKDGEERICKMVFIGRNLDKAKLEADFLECKAED